MCSRISSPSPGVVLPFVDYSDLMLKSVLSTVNMGRRIANEVVGGCQLLSSFGHSHRQESGTLLGYLAPPYLKSARECAHSDDGYLDLFVVVSLSRGKNRMNPG